MSAPVTHPDEIARKLAWIAKATAEELAGWAWAMRLPGARPAFDGERAAFAARQKAVAAKNGAAK